MADTTESSIVIDAEPGAILDAIADLEAYPEWTGAIKGSRSSPRRGTAGPTGSG